MRGLFGPNYGTGITDSEPRRSSFKRSSSVRKSVTFTDTPLISTQPTEPEPEVITAVEIEDEPAEEEFFAKTGNTAYPRESDDPIVDDPEFEPEPLQKSQPVLRSPNLTRAAEPVAEPVVEPVKESEAATEANPGNYFEKTGGD